MLDQQQDGEPCLQAVALDGKVLCGSYDRDLGQDSKPLEKPAQQQLTALDLDSSSVIGQLGFSGQTQEAEGDGLRELGPGAWSAPAPV